MENAINSLRIRNFKSIKDVTLQPRRVNLIIGQPNVGKSNVLEALSLLGAGLYERGGRFLGDVIRYEQVANLFYDNDTGVPIEVQSNIGGAALQTAGSYGSEFRFTSMSHSLLLAYAEAEKSKGSKSDAANSENYLAALGNTVTVMTSIISESIKQLEQNQQIKQRLQEDGISFFSAEARVHNSGEANGFTANYSQPGLIPKKYQFRAGQPHNSLYRFSFLEPPLGHNLWEVIQRHPALRKEVAALFRQYGLKLVMRVGERKFEIQKEEDDLVYTIPYSLIADTLQRIIFYLAAIESNKDSVLLFEEPEAHTFPVYTTMLGQRIVASTSNQFFVATHSPYLLTTIIEEMLPQGQAQDLAIFLAYYEDYQTKFYQMTDAEVLEIRRDAIDVFYNLPRYTPSANPYA